MEERKHWLLSRKFWLAVVTALTMVLSDKLGLELDPETVVAIILPVVAYILGESIVDAKAVKKNGEQSVPIVVATILVKTCTVSHSRCGIIDAKTAGGCLIYLRLLNIVRWNKLGSETSEEHP